MSQPFTKITVQNLKIIRQPKMSINYFKRFKPNPQRTTPTQLNITEQRFKRPRENDNHDGSSSKRLQNNNMEWNSIQHQQQFKQQKPV